MTKQIPIVNHNKQVVSNDCAFFVERITQMIKKYRQRQDDCDITQQIVHSIILEDLVTLLSDFAHR